MASSNRENNKSKSGDPSIEEDLLSQVTSTTQWFIPDRGGGTAAAEYERMALTSAECLEIAKEK